MNSVALKSKKNKRYLPHEVTTKFIPSSCIGKPDVGLSTMCYTLGKEKRTCLGDFQLRGLIGKLLY